MRRAIVVCLETVLRGSLEGPLQVLESWQNNRLVAYIINYCLLVGLVNPPFLAFKGLRLSNAHCNGQT